MALYTRDEAYDVLDSMPDWRPDDRPDDISKFQSMVRDGLDEIVRSYRINKYMETGTMPVMDDSDFEALSKGEYLDDVMSPNGYYISFDIDFMTKSGEYDETQLDANMDEIDWRNGLCLPLEEVWNELASREFDAYPSAGLLDVHKDREEPDFPGLTRDETIRRESRVAEASGLSDGIEETTDDRQYGE